MGPHPNCAQGEGHTCRFTGNNVNCDGLWAGWVTVSLTFWLQSFLHLSCKIQHSILNSQFFSDSFGAALITIAQEQHQHIDSFSIWVLPMGALIYYNPSIQGDCVPPCIVIVLFSKNYTVSKEAILRWLEWMQYLLLNFRWIKCVWAAGQNYLLSNFTVFIGWNS